jgi:hypothetical protein
MRDRTQLMNAANVRLGRTAFDFYDSAEPSYTLYTDRDYDISLDDMDERELEQHYGRRFRDRGNELSRQQFQGRNVDNRRRNEDVENYRNYEDIHGGDYEEYYDEFEDEMEEDFEDRYEQDFDDEFEEETGEEMEEDRFSEQRRRDHVLRSRLNELQRPSRSRVNRYGYSNGERRNLSRRSGGRNERPSSDRRRRSPDTYGPERKW